MSRSVPVAVDTQARSGSRGLTASRAGPLDRWALSRIARGLGQASVRVVLWDGTEARGEGASPIGSIVFRDRRTLFAVARDPDFHLAEGYMRGALEVEGDLVAVAEAIDRATEPRGARGWWRSDSHGLRRSRENVHHHYDVGNDFYRLWLDRQLLYTCAYFPDPSMDLEEAQVAKMDHVCRKLALRPGERVVEAGCGWGALALHMARSYGVTVKAYNISREQIAYARRRAAEEGLEGRVEFVEDDYRRIEGRFDAFVSVGMLEHVGLENYPTLGAVIDRSLGESGRGLLHFIGRNRPAPLNSWIRRRIFPGAYPPTLAEAVGRILEPRAFSVLDVENLRLHYARTLEHWRRRFEAAAAQVEARFGPRFTRAWRVYLAGSEAAFRAGSLQLFQVTFARGRTNAVPWRRGGLDVTDGPASGP